MTYALIEAEWIVACEEVKVCIERFHQLAEEGDVD
jgi:hypothetical protein